ncbi:MAG: hypothetical protein HY565_05230, partial [Candidatus Kerfeldbacteria bacterium]|nr:hypothetical protein [Candidatus Kerfeldbacteria bacterium]
MRQWFKTYQRDLLILLACIVVSIAINLPAYWYASSDAAQLNVLSNDEWVFQDFLETQFFRSLTNHDLYTLVTLHDGWGYGSLFWYAYGLVSWPFHAWLPFQAYLISLRCISAAWLGVSLFFVIKSIWLIRQKYAPAVLGAAFILAMPAYYFYTKAFSVEFMAAAIGLAGIYWLLSKKFPLVFICLGMAVGLKLPFVLFLPVAGVAMLIWYRGIKKIIYCAAAFGLGFILANPYLVTLGRTGINFYIHTVQSNMLDNASGHGLSITGIDYAAWFSSVITVDYLPLGLVIICTGFVLYNLWQSAWQRQYTVWLAVSAMILFMGYIMLTVNKLWFWYLFPAGLLLPIGIFTVRFGRWAKYELPVLGLLVLVVFGVNAQRIQTNYQSLRAREFSESFQRQVRSAEQFDGWLSQQTFEPISILKSPYIYFDQTPYPTSLVRGLYGNLD